MTKRKPITDRMKWQSCIYWGDVRCAECGCLITVWDEIEWDHRHALILGGGHLYDNIRPLHVACHTQKTIRDVKANAKCKRLENVRNGLPKRARDKYKKKIPTAPFPKRHRPMNPKTDTIGRE